MFVRKNMGAALMDRATACRTYPPGSDAWARWNCGPVPSAAPAPAQATAPAPTQNVPSPAQVIVTVDNAAAQRAEREYNERLRAQMAETEAQREKSAAEATALKAQREADALRAQSNSALVDWEGGSAGYSTSGGSGKTNVPAESKTSMYLLLGLFAAVGLIAASKKK